MVAWLEPASGEPGAEEAASPASAAGPHAARTVRLGAGGLEPSFLVVARSRPVRFRNEEKVYHRLFSPSAPNDFDTGLLREGESRTVAFRQAGIVRLYSSLDETLDGAIFVAPSHWFAVVESSGRFLIRDVEPGVYRLRIWRNGEVAADREVRVHSAGRTSLELEVGGREAAR